ncbi:MAG: alpha/beta hydrolase [Myxococcota bacterium]
MSELLDHPIIGARYFFPRPDAPKDPWFVDVSGERLACVRTGEGSEDPALLMFHGNGEVASDWLDFAAALASADLSTVLGEYRGYGGSTGTPALGAMLDDALAIYDAAPSRFVYGRSVGSIYALHVAAHRPVAGLILESGIADVYERLRLRLEPRELGVDEAELRAAIETEVNQQRKIERTTCPVLILHTDRDHLVHVDHAERLAEWAGERAELVRYPEGDHNSIHYFNGADILRRVVAFAS